MHVVSTKYFLLYTTHAMSCDCANAAAHEADCEAPSLFAQIDMPRVRCGNEAVPGSAASVLRPLARRRETQHVLQSSDDPELLLHIPLTSPCRVTSLCVGSPPEGGAIRLRLFVNRDALDFSTVADATPDQELHLPPDFSASLWHPLKQVKFGNASSLMCYFTAADTAEGASPPIRISFIGLKGVSSGIKRGVVTAVYESRPQLSDHATRADAERGRMGM